jgi:hypothetical protein
MFSAYCLIEVSAIPFSEAIMLIWLKQPSYVFHAHDISPQFYTMWKTVTGKPGMTPNEIASSIYRANVESLASGSSMLKNVVINVHGSPGYLRLAGLTYSGSILDDMKPFSVLNGIGTIWMVSCNVAGGSEGKHFCSGLARMTGSVVVASEQSQIVTALQAFQLVIAGSDRIDAFEGKLIAFYPNGATRSDSNPRNLVDTVEDPIKPESEYPEEAWLRGSL